MKRLTMITCLAAMAMVAGGCAGTEALSLTQQSEPGTQTGPFATQTPSDQGGTAVAAVPADARIQFAPVIGATAESLPALSSRLTARANQRGITVTQQPDNASHVIKGYFSAIADGDQTTVIYVWDVLDPSGARLHRIQGQERAPAGREQGWPSVTDTTMEAVADRTIDELTMWLSRSSS